jgi:beta-lactamase class A
MPALASFGAGGVHPFGTQFREFVQSRDDRVGAAVLDLHTDKLYIWHAHQTFDTASIVKVQIMGAVLHRAQNEHRTLTGWERQNLVPMIEESDNDAATRLWDEMGGAAGIADFDREVGMSHTAPADHWGLTQTTAPDNVRLIHSLIRESRLYNAKRQQYALGLMEHVVSWQRWGVSGGVAPGTTIALKNGWLPLTDNTRWVINSIGWIEGHGRDYILAVLTDENPSQEYGIDTIQHVSRIVWNQLG